MAVLTTERRNRMGKSNFAIVEYYTDKRTGEKKWRGRYPINDRRHAINAIARVNQSGTPAEKKAVIAAVKKKFPKLPYFQKGK